MNVIKMKIIQKKNTKYLARCVSGTIIPLFTIFKIKHRIQKKYCCQIQKKNCIAPISIPISHQYTVHTYTV